MTIIIYLPQSLSYLNIRDVIINKDSILETDLPNQSNKVIRMKLIKNNEYLPLISWLSLPNDKGDIKYTMNNECECNECTTTVFNHDCQITNFNEDTNWVEFTFSVEWFS